MNPKKPHTIVLAGDAKPADARSIESVVSGLGHRFLHSKTSGEALRKAAGCGAGLILACPGLSEPDGDALVSGLRGLKRKPPVVWLSDGNPVSASFEKGLKRTDIYDLVPLALDPELLALRLGRALEAGGLRDRMDFFRRTIRVVAFLIPLSALAGMLLAMT